MESVRYWLAVITVVGFPPVLLTWFIVHPLAPALRRLGPVKAYPLICVCIAVLMAVMIRFHEPLLSIGFRPNPFLTIVAAALLIPVAMIGFGALKRMGVLVMVGLPEVSARAPQRLVSEGIYAHVRHPRYLQVGLGLLAIALFTNYLAVYALFAAYLPLIYAIVRLEERELRERFGDGYDQYCRGVPRFLPKLSWPRSKAGHRRTSD